MLKVENRESAHIRSRVKDMSVVPNPVEFTGLFTAITPIAKIAKNAATGLYDPILVRDTNSLIANFGDPRIDPEKYIDLYSIMQVVGNGTSCYVCKVDSGAAGVYSLKLKESITDKSESMSLVEDTDGKTFVSEHDFTVLPDLLVVEVNGVKSDGFEATINGSHKLQLDFTTAPAEDATVTAKYVFDVYPAGENPFLIRAYSAMSESITISCALSQAKPYSLDAIYLVVKVSLGGADLASAKVKLDNSTTNQNIVSNLNSALSPYVSFELDDENTAGSAIVNDPTRSIVKALFDDNLVTETPKVPGGNKQLVYVVKVEQSPNFDVDINDYIDAVNQYKDKKYVGCLMSDMVSPVSSSDGSVAAPKEEDRRSLHFYLKQVACERKDCTVVLSTPYCTDPIGEQTGDTDAWNISTACDWVAARGTFENHWNYSETNTTDYNLQGFYLEMYYSWLNQQCTQTVGSNVTSVYVKTAPSCLVINNILKSWSERGTQYPVAGDQYGVLPDSCTVLMNPKTKLERDQLVQDRINPIYDTGTRGIQIYGNETLNAGYTDLNAAHIARTLVYIRSTIDEYTEKLKFSINSMILWDTWKNYVSQYILEPLKSANALSEYRVEMGTDTTSSAEIANRQINGIISLIFYQSAEIFDLSYVVYSSATTIDEARNNL